MYQKVIEHLIFRHNSRAIVKCSEVLTSFRNVLMFAELLPITFFNFRYSQGSKCTIFFPYAQNCLKSLKVWKGWKDYFVSCQLWSSNFIFHYFCEELSFMSHLLIMCILSRKLNSACRFLCFDDKETYVFMTVCACVQYRPCYHCTVTQEGLHLSHTRSQVSYLAYGLLIQSYLVAEAVEFGGDQRPSSLQVHTRSKCE